MPPKLKTSGKICNFTGENSFLSNFYWSNIEFEGEIYPTAEHLFQACKSKNGRMREWVRGAYSPQEAKNYGRNIELREDWESVKIDVMQIVITLKFLDDKLKAKLLETGNKKLEEGNYWHDNHWGNCTCPRCYSKPGKNQLGKTLMEVRELYAAEAKKERKI